MNIEIVTNKSGFSLLTTTVMVNSEEVTAVIDTGASVSLISPDLVARHNLAPRGELKAHGLTGPSWRKQYTISVEIGGDDLGSFSAIALPGKFVNKYDLVLGLDVILKTGLTITAR